jgi:hypothetical protein
MLFRRNSSNFRRPVPGANAEKALKNMGHIPGAIFKAKKQKRMGKKYPSGHFYRV